MFKTTKALILREVKYKEADRILTVLTAEDGKQTVKAQGALRKTSKFGAATQVLTFSELTLFGNRGRWSVREGTVLDRFEGLRTDLESLSVAAYLAEVLEAAISVDEGAAYFGEVALVPYDSPISNQKLLFYNTLFDENAACHIAFGEAYPCIEGGRDMDKEELKARGLNDSVTHVDFMVGTADLSIVGTTRDGREIPIFENGNFAI